MRTRGIIIYYEAASGKALIAEKGSSEIYFVNRKEITHPNAVLYKGLEVSFKPFIENNEAIARKLRITNKFKTGTINSVNSEDDRGYITDRHGNEFWFKPSEVIVTGNKRMQQGDNVQFFASEGNHRVQFAYEVACDKRSAIAKFTGTKNWDGFIAELANLAEEETWNYRNFETEPFPLLRNYMLHTFQHVYEQEKIGYFTDAERGCSYAIFHTGLVSKNNEDIYGLFYKPADSDSEPHAPHGWAFAKFTDQWMYLLLRCDRTPLPASYRCTRGSEIYDPHCEVRTNMDILMKHQRHNFPKSLLLLDEQQCAAGMAQVIEHTVTLLRSGKIIPVPKYFYGSFEFTAPLYVEGKQLDAALVIKMSDADYYLANQMIPSDIAYKNARLLGRVNSEWLKPDYVFTDIPVEQNQLSF